MRRALAGIVPNELIHRKRKAFVIRGPLTAITSQFASLATITQEMVGGSLGIVDPPVLIATLNEARSGDVVAVPSLMRVFGIERWLRNAAHWKVLEDLDACAPRPTSPANASVASPGRELKTSLS
jgi:asparagine synthase (glutamine-hydrolysing)